MMDCIARWMGKKVRSFAKQFEQQSGLPFYSLLEESQILTTLENCREEEAKEGKPQKKLRDRIFTPLVTIGAFLSQVLSDRSCCRQAVTRVAAYRLEQGLEPCAYGTSSYCKAKERLPEAGLKRLVVETGARLEREVPPAWLWHGRPVKIADGTTVSMPDTEANQKAYPQPRSQAEGVGFPIARLEVIFGLATGAVLEAGVAPYAGKGTSELSLFYHLLDTLRPGDIVVADCYYDAYVLIALLLLRGIDVVVRMKTGRKVDFRRGQRLGRHDHLMTWQKPRTCPPWLDPEVFAQIPETLCVREMRVEIPHKGFRTQVLRIVTTLLSADDYPTSEVAEILRRRWQAELHLRSLKPILHMDVLTGQTPEIVRKEIWTHLLGYNLIRGVMTQAALQHHLQPWQISFSGALQTVVAYHEILCNASTEERPRYYYKMLTAIASHRVGDRPNRVEPRARKRRAKPHPFLTVPRDQARARLLRRRTCA